MKTTNRKASPSVLIVLIVAVILVISVTFAAIFAQSTSATRTFTVSNLAAESVVTFDGVSNMTPYTSEYGVRASVNPSDPNFIGNLRVSVQYKGNGVGLIRVRMTEEWSTSVSTSGVETERTVQPYRIDVPYTLSATYTSSDTGNKKAWFDNRKTDYCFYFATPVYANGTSTISLIEGLNSNDIDLAIIPSNTQVHILAEADVVQVNRYPQYWGMTSLPWNGGVSLTEMELSTTPAVEP